MLIGFIVSGIVEEYTSNLCKGIEKMAEADGVNVVVIPGKYLNMNFEEDLKNKYGYCFNSLYSYGLLSCFDGLIIEMASVAMYSNETQKEKFAKIFKDVPHVFISFSKRGYSSVTLDNKAGLNDALEYMYTNGARKFAMIGGPDKNIDAKERKQCFENFLKKYELVQNKNNYVQGSFFLDCSKEAEQLVANNLDADAFICANDILAIRIYEACRKYNLKPGIDVSVLGFDDSKFCISTFPSISSVRTDVVNIGKESYKLLMDIISGRPARKVVLPSHFVLRDSICHRGQEEKRKTDVDSDINYILKANVQLDEIPNSERAIDKLREILSLLNCARENNDAELLNNILALADEKFLSEYKDLVDGELFLNLLDYNYKKWFLTIDDYNLKNKIISMYIKIINDIMKYNRKTYDNQGIKNMDATYMMEAFFRDTMQFAGNSELNYSKIFDNLDFLGIENAFLYLYDEPLSYMQGEIFEIPQTLNLKACLLDGKTIKVPQNKQKILKENIFYNDYLDWKDFSKLYIFPVYAENYLYGVVICDIKPFGFSKAELFVNQISAAIRMFQLRIQNNKIMNEYEESMRRLKENNITLDTMTKTDPLTGLNNRRGFFMRYEKMRLLCPSDTSSMLVGYADMNNLKIINDRFGHDEGDYALKSIGSVLTDFVTMYNGFAARIGGDEFAFTIAVPTDGDLTEYRKELQELFDDFNKKSIKQYIVSASVGFSLINKGDDITIEDALNSADEKLYIEKNEKNRNVLKANLLE